MANFFGWRHVRASPASRIVGPGFRQIKGAVDEGVTLARDIGREHADLAVGDLAGRAGVLPADATGGFALLQESRLVHDEHRVRLGQDLDHVLTHYVAQSIGIPVSATQQGLLAPGARIAGRFSAHPACLAPLGPQQDIQEQPCGLRHALLPEQRPDPLFHLAQ